MENNQEIIYTHRTRDGLKARIVAKINNPTYPVIAAILNEEFGHEGVKVYTEDLKEFSYDCSVYDLFEYNPWHNVKVDTRILVRQSTKHPWERRHFAKFQGGFVYAYADRLTSWTSTGEVTKWYFAKLPDDKE